MSEIQFRFVRGTYLSGGLTMGSIKKRYLILGIVLLIVIGLIAAGIGILMYAGLPLKDGTQLAEGRVRVVVTRWGPVAIGAYLFRLEGGGFGLIDAGIEPDAKSIRIELARLGGMEDDVRVIIFTHGHDDHTAGARSFPKAEVYALEPEVNWINAQGIRVTRGLKDGESFALFGTVVEVFSLPGHTSGSAAYLVHGVLFLGDSAASVNDGKGSVMPNTILCEDKEQNIKSLRELAKRLSSRRNDIRHIAFGHQGPVDGLAPLLNWAKKSF